MYVSRRQFHALGLYNEFFRVLPVEHQMAVSLTGPHEQIIGIAVHRASIDFGEADRDLLDVPSATRCWPPCCALAAASRPAISSARPVPPNSPSSPTARCRSSSSSARAAPASPSRAPDVSPRMIAKHLEHIYRKPGVSGRRGPRHASTCSGHQKDRIAKRGVRPRAFLRSGRAPLPIYCCTEALSLRLPGSRCGDARRSARLRAEPGLAEGVVRAAE